MTKCLACVVAITLITTACATYNAKQHCGSQSTAECSPYDAKHAPLETLRTNPKELLVSCSMQLRPLDARYKAACRKKVESAVMSLNRRLLGAAERIDMSDVNFKDVEGGFDFINEENNTVIRVSTYKTAVSIPLH